MNSQSNFKKEQGLRCHTPISNYTTKLSYSKQYGTGTETNTNINGTE